ncbi:MAG: alpha-galactosidase [Chloroflexi bacterium]|nr:alpha-galactosidase [Chloroflexota bacterium]
MTWESHGVGYNGDSVTGDTSEHEVRYSTGPITYVESLCAGRWCGRYWSAGQHVDPGQYWQTAAFELRLRLTPSVEAAELVADDDWQWRSTREIERTDRGARHIIVELSRAIAPDGGLAVAVHTLLDGTAVLTRWLEITSHCRKPIALTGVAPWAGRLWARTSAVDPSDRVRLGHALRKEVPWEGWFGWTALAPGINVFRNDTDRLWDDPYFVLHDEASDEYFIGQLAWPANYSMTFNRQDGLACSVEPVAPKALRVLTSGETIRTPAVHLGYVKGGFDTAVQSMHDHIRRTVLPTHTPERAFRSEYLVPEDWIFCHYRGDAFNEANMKRCIDLAAAVGLEVFILDGPTWVSGYGNWLTPHPARFPRGLAPLVEHAHQRGLLFGAYFETEGGRDGDTSATWDAGSRIGCWADTTIFRQHPEWFIRANLDLTAPGAADYLEAELGRIIEHYRLDLYRHDANGIVFYPPGPGAGQTLRQGRFTESDYWRYYEALYAVFERVHARYPNVILQQAAAGNFRLDLASAGAFHEHFATDRGGYPWAYRMLSGLSVFLPPEILVNAFGLCDPAHLPDLDTTLRGAYALGATPMFFTAMLPKSADELTAEIQQRYLHHAHLYKSFIRPLLATSRVYHHAPVNATGSVESGDWLAMEFMAPDRGQGWATIVHLAQTDGTYRFKPRGLDGSREYAVTFDNTGRVETASGWDLMRSGFEIRAGPDRCSELVLFEVTYE